MYQGGNFWRIEKWRAKWRGRHVSSTCMFLAHVEFRTKKFLQSGQRVCETECLKRGIKRRTINQVQIQSSVHEWAVIKLCKVVAIRSASAREWYKNEQVHSRNKNLPDYAVMKIIHPHKTEPKFIDIKSFRQTCSHVSVKQYISKMLQNVGNAKIRERFASPCVVK